jgi:N-acetylglucosamine malate deacetylase 1
MNNPRFLLAVCLLISVGFLAGWLSHHWQNEVRSSPLQTAATTQPTPPLPPVDGKLRIIAFGAHPDDCEIKASGVAAKWAALGHHVKFVSVTNGDIGHWKMAGGPLARRRTEEALQADRLLGINSQVLDIHDGELEPTLANRRTITKLIREWKADVVLAHRPNDYHPDHRYTGILVQDAAYMVTVPFFCPDVPYLEKNPIFLYYSDNFQRPNPFRADLAVDIDDVMDRKLAALDALESQFFEGGANGSAKLIPVDAQGKEARQKQVRQRFMGGAQGVANKYRPKLVEIYGKERGEKVQYAEAFELCEYGNQPNQSGLRKLFPLFGKDGK